MESTLRVWASILVVSGWRYPPFNGCAGSKFWILLSFVGLTRKTCKTRCCSRRRRRARAGPRSPPSSALPLCALTLAMPCAQARAHRPCALASRAARSRRARCARGAGECPALEPVVAAAPRRGVARDPFGRGGALPLGRLVAVRSRAAASGGSLSLAPQEGLGRGVRARRAAARCAGDARTRAAARDDLPAGVHEPRRPRGRRGRRRAALTAHPRTARRRSSASWPSTSPSSRAVSPRRPRTASR